MNTQDLCNMLKTPDGGFTCHPYTYEMVNKGYAVSVSPEHGEVFSQSTFNNDCIKWYTINKTGLFITHENAYLGGWHDPETGNIHLDISIVVNTQEEAVELCRKHNQLAYYDFAAGKSVRVEAEEPAKPEFFDAFSFCMEWENGECDDEAEIEGFQQLINTGIVWQLQGMYGRHAARLIKAGYCTMPN